MLSSLSIVPSLLQETVETGPPVEVQVRVNTGGSVAGSVSNWKVSSPGIVTWPVGGTNITLSVAILIFKFHTCGPNTSSHSFNYAVILYKIFLISMPLVTLALYFDRPE